MFITKEIEQIYSESLDFSNLDTFRTVASFTEAEQKNGIVILANKLYRMIIDKLVRKANLDIKISPHTIRHTFATDMLEEGADLMTVKELLGHESLDTTSIYTHITNEQIKKTYNMAHPRAKK